MKSKIARKIGVIAISAALILTSLTPVSAKEAQTPADRVFSEADVLRSAGAGRYETANITAEALLNATGKTKYDNIIIASGVSFPDALAGSYLAAKIGAPIFIVDKNWEGGDCGGWSYVKSAIQGKLDSTGKVYILGGTSSVPAELEAAAKNLVGSSRVKRLKGDNRYDTNLEILKEVAPGAADPLLISDGSNYADSLSASAIGAPMLLVDKSTGKLNQAQKNYLADHATDFTKVYLIGGVNSVPDSFIQEIETALGITPERVSGAGRYETSLEIAEKFFSDAKCATIATGVNFPDGLTGGPLAFALGAPMLLTTNTDDAAATTHKFIAKIETKHLYIFGGTGSISEKTQRSIQLHICDSHSFGTWEELIPATCKDPGEEIRYCGKCDYKETREIPKSETHTYGDWVTTKPATLVETGSKSRTCSVCGHEDTEEIDKLDPIGAEVTFGNYYINGNWFDGKEPIEWYIIGETDTTYLMLSKYILFTSEFVNEYSTGEPWATSFIRGYISATLTESAFSADELASLVSHTTSDTTSDKIFLLSKSEADLIQDWEIRKAYPCASVASTGYNPYYPAAWWLRDDDEFSNHRAEIVNYSGNYVFDGELKTEVLGVRPAVEVLKEAVQKTTCTAGHTYSNYIEDQMKTCAVDGISHRNCTVCGHKDVLIEAHDPDDHTFSSWELTVRATCCEPGEESRFCVHCSHTETRVVEPTGEHFYCDWEILSYPTLTTEGSQKHSCFDCQHEETVTIPKLYEVGSVFKMGYYPEEPAASLPDRSKEEANIEWLVIKQDAGKVLVVSKKILFTGGFYYGSDVYPLWETSAIRSELEDFYNYAFSATEKTSILQTTVEAASNPNWPYFPAGNDTQDYVFLLSGQEFETLVPDEEKPAYCTNYVNNTYDVLQQVEGWALNGWNGARYNWLRTTGTVYADEYGKVQYDGYYNAGAAWIGVRPAMWITLD